jgi:hypothetical protein
MASCPLAAADSSHEKLIKEFRQRYISEKNKQNSSLSTASIDKQRVKNEIKNMADFDQKVRKDVYQKIFENCQLESLDCQQDLMHATVLMVEVDRDNLHRLEEIMKMYPWFKISEFGQETANHAWLIVQHSEKVDLQHKVLFIIEKLIKEGEADPEKYALLYDKISLHYREFGIKQRYGSQFLFNEDGKLEFSPCEGNLAQIDARRKELGLMPLSEYTKIILDMYKVKEVVGLKLD